MAFILACLVLYPFFFIYHSLEKVVSSRITTVLSITQSFYSISYPIHLALLDYYFSIAHLLFVINLVKLTIYDIAPFIIFPELKMKISRAKPKSRLHTAWIVAENSICEIGSMIGVVEEDIDGMMIQLIWS
ncbi:hypothetical protein ACJX0J_006489 [Zea mays]